MVSRSLLERIKKKEGFRALPYRDSVGVLTIWYGRNLVDHPFTKKEAEKWTSKFLEKIWEELVSRKPSVRELDLVRQEALLDMAYNLGVSRLLMFSRMWTAIDVHNWAAASREALDSRWARQVGVRAKEIASALLTGSWES